MKKLRVGIIGTGMAFERLHYPAFMELQDKYEIAALCDPDVHKAKDWAKRLNISEQNVYSDYREMIKNTDLDMFDIMVPIGKNFEVTEEVAKAGKPIICEKPLAPNLVQARAHMDLPKKYKIPIMIAENFRYNEEVDLIRDMIRTEKVGKPVYFIQNRVMNFPKDMWEDKFAAKEWRQHPDFPGGVLLDTGIHDLAALRHFFGAVDEVQAFGVPQNDDFAPYAVLNANIRFKSGITGQYTFYCAGKEMQRPLIGLRIFCTNGMIFLEERDCGTVNVASDDGRTEQIPYRPQRGYYNELLNFYNAAIGKERIAVTPEMEYGDAKMLFDILKSAQEGRIVQVDEEFEFMPAYAQHEGEVARPPHKDEPARPSEYLM
ncbi:MAG: Gfo/Idh/MocA family protein [Eubacteriales bacterium]